MLFIIRYDTIRYDSVYLTCSKKLTGSQLSLPHGINKKLKCETKKKMIKHGVETWSGTCPDCLTKTSLNGALEFSVNVTHVSSSQ